MSQERDKKLGLPSSLLGLQTVLRAAPSASSLPLLPSIPKLNENRPDTGEDPRALNQLPASRPPELTMWGYLSQTVQLPPEALTTTAAKPQGQGGLRGSWHLCPAQVPTGVWAPSVTVSRM